MRAIWKQIRITGGYQEGPIGANPTIPERQLIDDISSLEDEYERISGAPPENLSHWNAGPLYRKRLLPLIFGEGDEDILDYIFSDELPDRGAITAKLGFGQFSHESVVTSSGTASISLILHHIATNIPRPIVFLGPTYFSAVHLARRLRLMHRIVPLEVLNLRFSIQATLGSDAITEPSIFWVTNPVYGTGQPYSERDIVFLRDLARAGHMLVLDECYALTSDIVAPNIWIPEAVISVCSPHKALNVNAVKFSVVTASPCHALAMDHLADVVTGGLSTSTRTAIRHFASTDFERATNAMAAFVAEIHGLLVARVPQNVLGLSAGFNQPFMTMNFFGVHAELGWDRQFLRQVLWNTGATMIPACRNWMNPKIGFAFRINLARASAQFWPALARACQFLSSFCGLPGAQQFESGR